MYNFTKFIENLQKSDRDNRVSLQVEVRFQVFLCIRKKFLRDLEYFR